MPPYRRRNSAANRPPRPPPGYAGAGRPNRANARDQPRSPPTAIFGTANWV